MLQLCKCGRAQFFEPYVAQKWQKLVFLGNSYFSWTWQNGIKMNSGSQFKAKMFLFNQIARFFDEHLWNQSFDILDFLRRDTERRRSDWDCFFWLGVARCAQPRSNMSRLARVLLIGLGCVATLITVHNVTWVTL